jgi:hypothetical protein
MGVGARAGARSPAVSIAHPCASHWATPLSAIVSTLIDAGDVLLFHSLYYKMASLSVLLSGLVPTLLLFRML